MGGSRESTHQSGSTLGSILKRTEAEVERHFPACVPEQRVPKPFSFIKLIGIIHDRVRFVGEDHGNLHPSSS